MDTLDGHEDLTPEQREAAEAFTDDLSKLEKTVTQREWLLITSRLDRPRAQITEDGNLRLLALAWVRRVREHGGAKWDELLGMTDDELLELHHFPAHLFTDDDDDQADPEADPEG